jgi:hypothetical protein
MRPLRTLGRAAPFVLVAAAAALYVRRRLAAPRPALPAPRPEPVPEPPKRRGSGRFAREPERIDIVTVVDDLLGA